MRNLRICLLIVGVLVLTAVANAQVPTSFAEGDDTWVGDAARFIRRRRGAITTSIFTCRRTMRRRRARSIRWFTSWMASGISS